MTIMQSVQMIETKTVPIDVNQSDLLEKKLIQSNASFINQSEMNPLLNDVNLKSGTVLLMDNLDRPESGHLCPMNPDI